MGLVAILLLVVFVISALVLITVILIQDDQGEGLGGLFGAGSSSAFGPRTGNVLTRFTSITAAVFLLAAFGLAFMNRTPDTGDLLQRVRAQQLQNTGQQDWWVEVEPSQAGDAALEAGDAAPEAGAAPAPEMTTPAPAEGQRPAEQPAPGTGQQQP